MLFHIPKQSNWVECVIDFFASFFFSDEEGNSKILSWDRETTIIFINVCVQVCLCLCFESQSKNFQYMVEKSFEIVIFY